MSRTTLTDKLNRNVQYANKDFGELRRALINSAKNYFPNTYSDFNESSPGMLFIELAAHIGDVLNFHTDVQLQESLLYTVNERINLYNLAQGMGYKPKTIIPAQVDLDIMQLVPSIGEGTETAPDYNYALIVQPGMTSTTPDGNIFRTVDPVDFKYSSSFDKTEVSVYQLLGDGSIEYYLLKKCVRAVEGEVRSVTKTFTDAKIYDKIVINDSDVSEIIDITDGDGNLWHEVPYLSQDLVAVSVRNTHFKDPLLSQFRSTVPYLLCYNQTEKRFITKVRKDDKFEIQFGAGLSGEADEEIVPNPFNVAIGLDYFRRSEDVSIDPQNFLNTKTYGLAPSNTTLTIRYGVSKGIQGNVKANSITTVSNVDIINPYENVDPTVLTTIIDSIAINNPNPAYGGLNKKPLDVIREEAMANFAAQNRAVTREDYILRCYTMPAKYGAISKAYIDQDIQISSWNDKDRIQNPYALNLYILAYNADGQFAPCNEAIKENLRQYLRQYRMMTDAINIKNPFIINIGINYEIVTRPSYNSNEVLLRCNKRLMELLAQSKMEINAPIMMSNLTTELDKLDGVQTVEDMEVINLYDSNLGYSGNVYDTKMATRHNVLYPSMDPSIFEVRNPQSDIKGRVIDL